MYGLKKETITAIQSVLRKYGQVETAIIYGSRAMGNYRNGSDIDLALTGRDLTLTTIHQIENDLDDLLLPYQFDLSLLKDISNKELLAHIKRVGKVFFTIEQNATE
jgi:predicted nucleotidyltransferase